MGVILKTEGLTKKYFNKVALKDVDITLESGKILGLLGPNGSGKTTFLKIAAGILRPTSGVINIDNNTPGVYTKGIVSYLPDKDYFYKWMKIKDSFNFFNDMYDDFDLKKAREILDFMKLNEEDKITSLSKGMKEKLSLTLVFARRSKLYILDEPLGGVDPSARQKILDTIISSYNEDSSMIITTHLVNDIERVFDDVAFISDGEIILSGNAEELRSQRGKSIDELFMELYD